ARGRAHADRAEVAPGDLGLLPGERVEAQEGLGAGGGPDGADVAAHLDRRPGVAAVAHHGPEARGAQARVLLERRGDEHLEGIERAGPDLRPRPDEALTLDGAANGVVMHTEL